MGRFSTTVHIKNNVDRMRFVNTFCDVMKKRGFVPCAEDEVAQSYLFAFGEGWVTLANEDYKDNPKKSSDDIREMSAALKTSAFSVEVVDSDFAIMTLCTPNGTEDTVVVGDGSGYGVDTAEGDRKLWMSLLADGKTWEQFSEAAAAQEVFAERALGKVAAVLGIDPYYMDANYDEVLEKADGNNNITVFYFKNATEKSKSMSFNAAFVKVFGDGLKPLGFKRLKNLKHKCPYFVRVVNGDILHVVSYRQTTSPKIGYKEFEVYCGVMTLYRREISFPSEPDGILIRTFELYHKAVKCGKIDPSVKEPQINYLCNATDSEEMLRKLERVFNETMEIFLNYIDKITDLEACVEYFKTYMNMSLYPFDEFITLRHTSWSEALLLVKTRDMDDSLKRIKKEYKDYNFRFLGTRPKQEDIENFLKKKNEERLWQYEYRLEMINNPELNKRVLDEMERCKANNIELLKSYGLDI